MIEEITRPESSSFIWIGMFMILGGIFASVNILFTDKRDLYFVIAACVTVFGVIILAIGILDSDTDEWNKQIDEQIESLDCSEFEEAYNIYGLESIKEKYLFRCVDTREGWLK